MPIAFLIARQRSGTGALNNILHQHKDVFPTGEVFHAANIESDKRNYFRWLRTFEPNDPILMPDQADQRLLKFLEYLQSFHPEKTVLIDAKYRSLHHFDGYWRGPTERPHMLGLLTKHKIPVINLLRKNTLACWVSGRLAEANKVWHTRNKNAVKVSTIKLVPIETLDFLQSAKRDNAVIYEAVDNHPKAARIYYKRFITDDGYLSANAQRVIQQTLNLASPPIAQAKLIKQAPRKLADAIENLDEMIEALRDTEFAWMLED